MLGGYIVKRVVEFCKKHKAGVGDALATIFVTLVIILAVCCVLGVIGGIAYEVSRCNIDQLEKKWNAKYTELGSRPQYVYAMPTWVKEAKKRTYSNQKRIKKLEAKAVPERNIQTLPYIDTATNQWQYLNVTNINCTTNDYIFTSNSTFTLELSPKFKYSP